MRRRQRLRSRSKNRVGCAYHKPRFPRVAAFGIAAFGWRSASALRSRDRFERLLAAEVSFAAELRSVSGRGFGRAAKPHKFWGFSPCGLKLSVSASSAAACPSQDLTGAPIIPILGNTARPGSTQLEKWGSRDHYFPSPNAPKLPTMCNDCHFFEKIAPTPKPCQGPGVSLFSFKF